MAQNRFTLDANQDNHFALIGDVIQGDDLIITIKNLSSNASTSSWNWENRTIPSDYRSFESNTMTSQIQGALGTGSTGTVSFSNTTTAVITVPLPVANSNFNPGKGFSFIWTQGTQKVQVYFTVSDVNAGGASSPIPPIPDGFIALSEQSTTPTAQSNKVVLYSDQNNVLKAIHEDGTIETIGDKNQVFPFTNSSTVTITHNLNKYPAITVVNSAQDEIEAAVNHVSLNQTIVTFAGNNSGTVYCN